jgi:hypothetical protein
MTATTSAKLKLIRLVGEKNQGRIRSKHIAKRKNVAWVDLSDDEDGPKKTPFKVVADGHPQAREPRRNKKARHLIGVDGREINCAGPSTNALLQEQRKQLPIAKGRLGGFLVRAIGDFLTFFRRSRRVNTGNTG